MSTIMTMTKTTHYTGRRSAEVPSQRRGYVHPFGHSCQAWHRYSRVRLNHDDRGSSYLLHSAGQWCIVLYPCPFSDIFGVAVTYFLTERRFPSPCFQHSHRARFHPPYLASGLMILSNSTSLRCFYCQPFLVPCFLGMRSDAKMFFLDRKYKAGQIIHFSSALS